ncbi:MAG: hypothetical protein QNJ73_15495 [Gammaproteobacteria bacterium]|nr:hypothetical protein [Gammaproteobacteria bacterium]
MRTFLLSISMLSITLAGFPAGAQVDEAPATDSDDVTEEIVVKARKPGDQVDVEAQYRESLRLRLLRELDELQVLEEEYAWRTADQPVIEGPGRITWGFDPVKEEETRDQRDIWSLPADRTKPATLFRAQF